MSRVADLKVRSTCSLIVTRCSSACCRENSERFLVTMKSPRFGGFFLAGASFPRQQWHSRRRYVSRSDGIGAVRVRRT